MSSIVPQAVEQPAKADGAREVRGSLEVTRAPQLSRVVRRLNQEMGRQIHFHMLGRDCDAFFAAAKHFAPFVTVIRDSPTVGIEPVDAPCAVRADLMLWNKAVAPSAVRTYVPNSVRGPYHRFPYDVPALEFCPTGNMSEWDGRPAIGAGRLYAAGYQDNLDLANWYEKLAGCRFSKPMDPAVRSFSKPFPL
jgi:hypothetical protein